MHRAKWMIFFMITLFSFNSLAETISFGVVPQQSAKKLAALWTPVLQYLSQQTGLELRFTTAKDIPEFEKRVLAGEYDLAYMNPYHYTVFCQTPGYQAIAKEADKVIKGIFVVGKDSPINSLEQLNGATIAFPSPAAFAASIITRAKLRQSGIEFTPKYVSSHDSVYLNVQRGFFPAGGGIMRTLNNTAPEVRSELRVLWTTPGYTSHAIAAHPRVELATRQKIVQAMLAMSQDPQGKALLAKLNFKGLEEAEDKQWDDVRALNIDLLDKLLQ